MGTLLCGTAKIEVIINPTLSRGMERILTEFQRVLGVSIDLAFLQHLSNDGVQSNVATKNNYFIKWFTTLPVTRLHQESATQFKLVDAITGATVDTIIKQSHTGVSGFMYRSPEHFYKPFTIVLEAFNPSSLLFDDEVFMDEYALRNLLTEIFVQTVLWCDGEISRYFSRPHHLIKLNDSDYLIDMDVIQGYSLEEALEERSPITIAGLKPFIVEIAGLFKLLQGRYRFQHGDLHNQNILVDAGGQLKIIDFDRSSVILGDMLFGRSSPKGYLWRPEDYSRRKDLSDLLQSIREYQASDCAPETIKFLLPYIPSLPRDSPIGTPEEVLAKFSMVGGRCSRR